MDMETTIARNFNTKVRHLVTDAADREQLYAILAEYKQEHSVPGLVAALRTVIDRPPLLALYECIRPLVPARHQLEYDRLAPSCGDITPRCVRLRRHPSQPLGFTVRGGLEHGVGLFVSHVEVDSLAYEQGLRIGDEIVRVNGFTISQAIHQEALNLIKGRHELVLRVSAVGMLPVRDQIEDKLTWKYLEPAAPRQPKFGTATMKDVKLHINVPLAEGLGCSICRGTTELPGIFIQSVREGSVAQEAGLEVGDQILAVNNTPLGSASHSQAVVALKRSRQLHLSIRKAAGVEFLQGQGDELTAEEEKALQLQHLTKTRSHGDESTGTKEDSGIGSPPTNTLIHHAIRAIQDRDNISRSSKVTAEHSPHEKTARDTQPHDSAFKMQSSPVYKTYEHSPNFRIQKPILLHPTPMRSSGATSPLSAKNLMSSENFNPSRYFTEREIGGREVKAVSIDKGVGELGMVIEETARGRITVAEVYKGGAVHKHGGVQVGDQLMMVSNQSLLPHSLEGAYDLLKAAFASHETQMKLVIAKVLPNDRKHDVLQSAKYFDIPISNLDDFLEDDDVEICMYNDDVPVTVI